MRNSRANVAAGWAILTAMVLSATPVIAQFGGSYLTPTPTVGTGYGGFPFSGYGWGIGPRLSNYGNFGPRAVTWYTPGQGYSSYVANGLPWQGSPVSPRAYQYPSSTGMGIDGAIAREERYRMRFDTLQALQQQAYASRNLPPRNPSVMAASAKEVEAGPVKKTSSKKSTAKKPAVSKDEPTRVIPVEGTTSSDEYSSGDTETLSTEKKLIQP